MKKLGLMLIVCGLSMIASAAPITYIQTAVASGQAGESSFTDALVTITFLGDTTNVYNDGIWRHDATGASINIAGIGSGTLTDLGLTVYNNGLLSPGYAGFGNGVGTIFSTANAAFAGYNLQSAIGPIAGTVYYRSDLSYGSTLGTLRFSSSSDATFEAQMGPGGEVPEPGTIGLMGLGLGGVLLLRRRK